jgi:hypothetical protein
MTMRKLVTLMEICTQAAMRKWASHPGALASLIVLIAAGLGAMMLGGTAPAERRAATVCGGGGAAASD